MFDTVIRGGRLVDGSGKPAFVGDIGIRDSKIAAVGGKLGSATRVINADGALVTPGWVDGAWHRFKSSKTLRRCHACFSTG